MYDIAHLDIPPILSAGGTVRLPGSKSISNRVLLLAGLCDGQTLIHDLLDSDDTQVMLAPLQALGFTLDEIVQARLAPVVDFKGRRPKSAPGTEI